MYIFKLIDVPIYNKNWNRCFIRFYVKSLFKLCCLCSDFKWEHH